MIYDQLVAELLFDPLPRTDDPPTWPQPVVNPLDLTRYDHLAVNTAKVHPDDDAVPQPPQDPRWIPRSVVDEHGRLL